MGAAGLQYLNKSGDCAAIPSCAYISCAGRICLWAASSPPEIARLLCLHPADPGNQFTLCLHMDPCLRNINSFLYGLGRRWSLSIHISADHIWPAPELHPKGEKWHKLFILDVEVMSPRRSRRHPRTGASLSPEQKAFQPPPPYEGPWRDSTGRSMAFSRSHIGLRDEAKKKKRQQ